MNFLVTDGVRMVASRRHKSLFFSGGPSKPEPGTPVPQLVIASEELSSEDGWRPVPEDTVVGVDQGMIFRRWTLDELL